MSAEVEVVNKSSQEKTDEKIVMGDAEVKNDSKIGDTPEVVSEKDDKSEENVTTSENAKNDKTDEKDNEANGDDTSDKEDSKTAPKTKEKVKNSKKTNSKQNECSEEDESVEGSEAENEKDEDDSGDEEEENDTKNKSGGRERKQVQRYSEEAPETKEKVEGSGIPLGNIVTIDNYLGRAKPDDLKALHKLLFKNLGKSNMIRRNIRKFNGFDFDEESEQYTSKLALVNKMDLKQIKTFCDMLDLEKKGSKEELATSICEFLLKPKDNNIIQEATEDTPSGRPRRSAALKASAKGFSDSEDSDDKGQRTVRGKGQRASLKDDSSSESDYNPSGSEGSDAGPKKTAKTRGRGRPPKTSRKGKDSDASDASEVSESEVDSDAPPKKRGRVAKAPTKTVSKRSARTSKKKAESELSESEEESAEESDEPKAKRGRLAANNKKVSPASNRGRKAATTPAKGRGATKKSPAGKKSARDSSSEESDAEDLTESEDEPLSKKGKSQPPTDDELKSLVKNILDGANLEEITMKTVCKQVYAKYPQFDLAHKKEFIKTTVKSLIST